MGKKKSKIGMRMKCKLCSIVGLIGVVIAAMLFVSLNNFIAIKFDFHETLEVVVISIEILMLLVIYSFVRAIAILLLLKKCKNKIEEECNSENYYHDIHDIFFSFKNTKEQVGYFEYYLYALQIHDKTKELQSFIIENKDILEKKKPMQYLNFQMIAATKQQDKEMFEKYYRMTEDLMLKRTKDNSKRHSYYEGISKILKRNKMLFNKEYESIIESKILDSNNETMLDKVMKNVLLAECYYYLQKEEEKQKCIQFCKDNGMKINTVKRRIIEIDTKVLENDNL
ncbi:MAG: hypothetical protein ACK5LC_06150 [Coprobacillaceae bacterium]